MNLPGSLMRFEHSREGIQFSEVSGFAVSGFRGFQVVVPGSKPTTSKPRNPENRETPKPLFQCVSSNRGRVVSTVRGAPIPNGPRSTMHSRNTRATMEGRNSDVAGAKRFATSKNARQTMRFDDAAV